MNPETTNLQVMSAGELARNRRTRRHPKRTQWDYLHLRYLVDDLAATLAALSDGTSDVLDVYCGSRPDEDLLPPGAHCTGLDIDGSYGVADVVSTAFLPGRLLERLERRFDPDPNTLPMNLTLTARRPFEER